VPSARSDVTRHRRHVWKVPNSEVTPSFLAKQTCRLRMPTSEN